VKIAILLFGGAATATGGTRAVIDAPDPCTCAAALRHLRDADTRLGPFIDAGRLAVNHAFAPHDREIQPGDEVALIALVSGG